MFKFKGISSEEMQVVIEEEEHFIARAAQRYEMTEIEGRDGAEFDTLGYSVVERPIYVQCLNIDKIDDILAWLDGEGEFEYKGRKTIARFYSQLEPQRSACIRIIDASFIRDPFWTKANDEFEIVKDRKDRQATGESITLNDSAEYKFKSLELSGNSKQDTREGYNVLDTRGLTEKTIDGVTYTPVYNDKGDLLYINVNGTATAISVYLIPFVSKTNTNYILSGCPQGGSDTSYKLYIMDNTDYTASFHDLGNNVSFNHASKTSWDVRIRIASGYTANNLKFYPMIVEGSEIKDYEPYGAMPSPDYKSDVKSCGDNVNLLDFTNYQSFTANNTYYAIKANDFNLSSNEEYIFNYIASGDFSTLNAIKLWFRDANNSSFKEVLANNEFSLTEEELNKLSYIQIVVQSLISGRTYSGYIYPKIEKGSVATPYSQYGQGCISEIVANKNELYIEDEVITNNGITITKKNGVINVKGTAIAQIQFGYIYLQKTFNESYILSAIKVGKITGLHLKVSYIRNNTAYYPDLGNSQQFIAGDYIKQLYFVIDKGSTIDATIKLQLEKGEVATDYISHAEQLITIPTQQPMRAVGDVRDGFIKKDGKRYERHWIKKLPLTYARVKGKNCYYYVGDRQTNIKKPSSNSEVVDWIKCNIAQSGVSANYLNSNDVLGVIISNIGDIGINFSNASGLTTKELATQFLEQNNVYTLYVMETPVDLECTEEQNSRLDELEKAQSYKNVTHIYSTNEVSPVANVTYYTETDEKIQNNGNIESRPILRLEKTTSDDVEMMINNIRFKYHFNNEEYVEIDCEEKETKYDDLNRSRQIEIGYEFPKLNVGENDIVMYEGDCIIKVLRKDRWL